MPPRPYPSLCRHDSNTHAQHGPRPEQRPRAITLFGVGSDTERNREQR
jgi:hypothetical protein